MNENKDQTSHLDDDREILKEAFQFLKRLRFTPNHGDYIESEDLSILVDPRWNDGNETIRVQVTCHARGQHSVEWSRLVVVVKSRDEDESLRFFACLNACGQVLFRTLPPGDYSVSCYELAGSVAVSREQPAVGKREGKRIAADKIKTAEEEVTAAIDGEFQEPQRYTSFDGRLEATVTELDGEIQIAFETKDRNLADAKVIFVLIGEEGETDLEGKVILEHMSEDPPLWAGEWQERKVFPESMKLVFQLLRESH